jgi:hypothetical protein
VGHIDRLEGTALVWWIRAQLNQPTECRLTPVAKPQRGIGNFREPYFRAGAPIG